MRQSTSPEILQIAGLQDKSRLLAATVAVGIPKRRKLPYHGFMVAISVIDRVGRKPLVYVSTIGMTFCLCGLAITLSLFNRDSIRVALVMGCVAESLPCRFYPFLVPIQWLFFIFTMVSALSIVSVYKLVPETKFNHWSRSSHCSERNTFGEKN